MASWTLYVFLTQSKVMIHLCTMEKKRCWTVDMPCSVFFWVAAGIQWWKRSTLACWCNVDFAAVVRWCFEAGRPSSGGGEGRGERLGCPWGEQSGGRSDDWEDHRPSPDVLAVRRYLHTSPLEFIKMASLCHGFILSQTDNIQQLRWYAMSKIILFAVLNYLL